ncbi:thylakoid lumenal 15 kDa protein 1, chloroplastic isoform X3 [Phragmites australis]|uniref:thylakoid lumenal 15 kDa protein 1, chloroplastic isoform X3 n=1 Tax=Phragmites australis TaxID=29695 RepID=UPI002D79E638|nr:thylakoid lumenal 15 kDa protein 1, chloroplastic isoform X3 [Phragmites australis]
MAILGALRLTQSPPALAGATPPATPGRSSLHFHLANAGAAALVAASLLVADPAPAFIVRRLLSLSLSGSYSRKILGMGGADGVACARVWPQGGGPYGKQVTRGQDLTGKDFSGQTLIKQDFKTSILRQVNFKGANLLGASFFDADLTSADLSDADLRAADFSLANLSKILLTFHCETINGNTSAKSLME